MGPRAGPGDVAGAEVGREIGTRNAGRERRCRRGHADEAVLLRQVEAAHHAVVGFGGYAGFCPVLAAALLGLPTAVHEQNSVPGVTNRILGKVARRVFVSFDDRLGLFPRVKVERTGNHARKVL